MKNILIGLLLLFGNVFGMGQYHPSVKQIIKAKQLYKENARSAIYDVLRILESCKDSPQLLIGDGDVLVYGYEAPPCEQIIEALSSTDDKKIKLFAEQCIINECSVIFPIADEQNFSIYSIKIIYSFSPSGLSDVSSGVFWNTHDGYKLKIGKIRKPRTNKYFEGVFSLENKIICGVVSEHGINYNGEFFCGMLSNGKITICNAEYDVKRLYRTEGRNKYIGEELLQSRGVMRLNQNNGPIKNEKIIKEMLGLNENASEIQMKLKGEFDHWCHEKGRICVTCLLNSNEYETEIGKYTKIAVNEDKCAYEIEYNKNVQAFIKQKIYSTNNVVGNEDATIGSCIVWCSKLWGLLYEPKAVIHVSFMGENNVLRNGILEGISTGFPISFRWTENVKKPITEYQFPIQRRGK